MITKPLNLSHTVIQFHVEVYCIIDCLHESLACSLLSFDLPIPSEHRSLSLTTRYTAVTYL